MAINNTTVVPVVVAAAFLVEYRKLRVYSDRTNNTWRNALRSSGDTVIVNTPQAGAVTDYAANGTVSYANADVGTPTTLTVDKVKSWSLKFDDLQRAQASLPVLTAAVTETAQVLAETVDADVRAAMVAGATDVTTNLALNHNKTGGLKVDDLRLSAFHRILDTANVPRTGRWAIIGPYTAEILQKIALANDQLLASSRGAVGEQLLNGSLGTFAGFNWYVGPSTWSNYSASGNTANEELIFGNDSATAFVDQVTRTEQLRLPNTFADAIRGLYSYGAKVVRGNRLVKVTAAVTNVPK